MILFDLKCGQGHGFEGWFRDGATCEAQAAKGEIACPICGDRAVVKAMMAPALARRGEAAGPVAPTEDQKRAAKAMAVLRQVHAYVEKNFDHVGAAFAEEARRIHHGEAERRNIYGEATAKEAKSLHDEGIEFGVLPRPPREDA